MRFKLAMIAKWRRRGFLGTAGAVAVELAIITPFLLLLIAGVIDFGTYMNNSQAIAAATRAGAEYAHDNSICNAGIASLAALPTGCTTGITSTVTGSGSLDPTPAVTATLNCESAPGTSTTCGPPCPGSCPCCTNRIFIKVSTSQTFTPIIPWPGIPASAAVAGVTEIRLQ